MDDVERLLQADRQLDVPYPTLKAALGQYFARAKGPCLARPAATKQDADLDPMPVHVKVLVGQLLTDVGAPPGSRLWEAFRVYATTSDGGATEAYRAIRTTTRERLHRALRQRRICQAAGSAAARAKVRHHICLDTGQRFAGMILRDDE